MKVYMPLQFTQIIGTPDDSGWSQIQHFLPDDPEKLEARGEAIVLISLKSRDYPDLSELGAEILHRFYEEYFGNSKGKIMERLKETLLKIGLEKSEYFKKPTEAVLTVFIRWKNIAYLAVWDKGRIILRRNEENGILISGETNQVKVASGEIYENDLFLLMTEAFFEKVSAGMIAAALSTEDLETISETLTPVVHSRQNQGSLALAAIKFTDKQTLKVGALENSEEKKMKWNLPFAKINSFLKQIIKSLFLKLRPFLKKVFTKITPKSPVKTVAIGFFILLAISVFFGWRKQAEEKKAEKTRTITASIEEKLKAAASLRTLDPENALKLAEEAKTELNNLEKINSEGAKNYFAQITAFTANLGEKPVEPELFYNFSLLGDNIAIQSGFTDGKKALFYDRGGKRLIDLDLETKKGEIIGAGEEVNNITAVFFSGARICLIKNGSLGLFENKKFKDLSLPVVAGDSILAGVWPGAIYILDKSGEQLWKYPETATGLGLKQSWFSQKPNLDFSDLSGLDINGSVWLLNKNGKIYKNFNGFPDKFTQEPPANIVSAKFLSAAKEAETLGFFEEEKKIVWIFGKSGELLSRMPVKINEVFCFFLSGDGKTGYLCEKDKLYKIEFRI